MDAFLQLAALGAIIWLGVFASLVLFSLYRVNKKGGESRFASWSFPLEAKGFSHWRLALVSLLGLFLEMLIIRWVSSEIRIFAYFKNFVLIACFLGFGMGCYLCRKRINVISVLLPLALLTALIAAPWTPLRQVVSGLPFLLGASSEVAIWGVPAVALDSTAIGGLVVAIFIIIPIFSLIALMFVPIGQMVGWYLEQARNGIRGYSLNVFASLVGILLYTLLCYLDQPPPVWIALAGAMLAILVWDVPKLRWTTLTVFVLSALAAAIPVGSGKMYWSPYQKLGLTPLTVNNETLAYELNTNDSWYQHIIDLSPSFAQAHPQLFKDAPLEWNPYNVPYQFAGHPPAVLVLGAGMGNDVAAALRAGAGNVVAVEIDPLIADLGKKLHFEKPYQSDRVHTVIDDARSYMQNSTQKFDLIMFSLLDSHTTSSHYSNIRIDNYVYTVEAMERAKRLLSPDGLFIIKFQVSTPWIAGRLQGLVERVFPENPLVRVKSDDTYSTEGHFFITGSKSRIASVMADPKLAAYAESHRDTIYQAASLTTDDWPYFYQHEPGLPLSVIVVSLCLMIVCWFALRQTEAKQQGIHWHFFFLGAGFMLVETQIISRMALLFGTTWVVNSIVVAGLMVLILGSNWLVEKVGRIPLGFAYAGVFLTIAAGIFVPMEWLFFTSVALKTAVSILFLCLPVFFAGIIFIQSFAAEGFAGAALGSNLMGALVGGLLESLSLWTGMRSMLILAALLYAGSYLTRKSSPALASEGLDVRAPEPVQF